MGGINPRDRESYPEYYAARRAISQHLWHHHQHARGAGTLAERIDLHDELHWARREEGVGHSHEPLGDEETAMDVAHRYFREGQRG